VSDSYHGVLLVNKPLQITSHDAVAEVRRTTGQRRIGHTGTLDPLAEGLLVLCVGRATKIAQHLSGRQKTYQAEVRLGLASRTYDAEGLDPEQAPLPVPDMTKAELNTRLERFRGHITQTVPAYSAVQVDGQRLYKLARQGRAVDLPEREVVIHRLEIVAYDGPTLKLCITCSSGTYIRALAHNIGEELGCGAYLKHLRRDSVGCLHLDDALSLSDVSHYHESRQLSAKLLRMDQVLDLSAVVVSADFAECIVTGRPLTTADVVNTEEPFESGDNIVLKSEQGLALAIGRARVGSDQFGRVEGELFEYKRVLN